MQIIDTKIEGLKIINPKILKDTRGYFFESLNKESFREHGIDANFVQDNHSLSSKGVFRGLHFQNPRFAKSSRPQK